MNQPAQVQQEERRSFEDEDRAEPIPPVEVVAYNELRSCADLYRLHTSGKLEIQPDFQRDVVWNRKEQSRFIDSLVKQLPIPSMCFSLDFKTQKWKVIDGLQRMSSIINFLSESEWDIANLDDIHPALRSVTNLKLRNGSDAQRRLFSIVEDVSIPITVIRCDYSVSQHMRYLFTIFHRLNSGGVRLNNQEIRNCIYTGAFNDTLKEFDRKNQDWKHVKRRIWGKMDRFRSVEILLRVLAFSHWLDRYDGNLAGFLNSYMHQMSLGPPQGHEPLEPALERMARIAAMALEAQTRKIPLALIEAVLVAIYVNKDGLASSDEQGLVAAFKSLQEEPTFADSARYAVSSVENVKNRINQARDVFSALP